MASRVLSAATGMTCARGWLVTASASGVVTRTLPAGPPGHRPSRSAASRRSSSTTSQGRAVWAIQPVNRAATSPAGPAGSMPTAAAASTYPDSTEARLLASTQASRFTWPLRHRCPARKAASWVLPHASASPGPPGPSASTTMAPGTSASARPGTVSGRVTNPSARAGTAPVWAGRTSGRGCAEPVMVTGLSIGDDPCVLVFSGSGQLTPAGGAAATWPLA